jgi:hypothetical protein
VVFSTRVFSLFMGFSKYLDISRTQEGPKV